jgi:hypothetical protein
LKLLLESCVLGFAVPSPKVIRRQFMEKTDAVRQWLKGVLRGKAVCISFDVWTRTSLSESYLGVCVRVRLGAGGGQHTGLG